MLRNANNELNHKNIKQKKTMNIKHLLKNIIYLTAG